MLGSTGEWCGDVSENCFFQEEELFSVGAEGILWLLMSRNKWVGGTLMAGTLRRPLPC